MTLAGRVVNLVARKLLKARVGGRDFTIVSNNCWGAHIYQQLGRPYQTPFVGVFLAPACYVTLVLRWRWYLSQTMHFVNRSKHAYVNALREQRNLRYPIGCLGGNVEVQFLHYESEAEALEKWTRRSQRISPDDSHLFFKFCDRDGCTPEQLAAFDAAPYLNKVCFVSKPSPHLRSAVWIPNIEEGQVHDGLRLSQVSHKYFDAAGWITRGEGHPRWVAVPRTVISFMRACPWAFQSSDGDNSTLLASRFKGSTCCKTGSMDPCKSLFN